jgi:uncharacterized protein (TIGR03435 family)
MTALPATLFHTARSVVLLIPLVVSLPLSAQSQAAAPASAASVPSQPAVESEPAAQPPLRFEVASIRPHPSGGNDPSNRQILPGGRFVATATSVRTLIRIAFGTDDNRISGAPGWIDSETFDINAITADHAEVTSPQQFQQLLLSLLEDRFQMKFHREQKEVPVYWLEVDKPGRLGPALRPSAPDSQPGMSNNVSGSKATMKVSKISMSDFAAALRRQAGRPVEDRTNLKGSFDFQIEWSPEEASDSADPSLFTVLKEQLGLKLQPATGKVETIVIDGVARPSDN